MEPTNIDEKYKKLATEYSQVSVSILTDYRLIAVFVSN